MIRSRGLLLHVCILIGWPNFTILSEDSAFLVSILHKQSIFYIFISTFDYLFVYEVYE